MSMFCKMHFDDYLAKATCTPNLSASDDSYTHVYLMQAVYRGFQVRKHYRKICWSVGVLEKALLRWRMKRRGFRGSRFALLKLRKISSTKVMWRRISSKPVGNKLKSALRGLLFGSKPCSVQKKRNKSIGG